MSSSSLGTWVTDYRFEFDPPLARSHDSSCPEITAFDLTPTADEPGLFERRDQELEHFVQNIAPFIDSPAR